MGFIFPIVRPLVLTVLVFASAVASTLAQEVSIPDPGLTAAIRAALGKPNGPLTEQDMLSLTNLNASSRNISNIVGLDAARNLVSLDLQINRLTNFLLPNTLTNLTVLDLSSNSLTAGSFPEGPIRLNSLNLSHNLFATFSLPTNLTSLNVLDLSFNGVTNVSLPSGLTNLSALVIRGNTRLDNLDLPPGLSSLETLDIDNNVLDHVTLPAGLKNLLRLNLQGNQLFSLSLPAGMTNLVTLFLDRNHLDSLALPADLTKLAFLELTGNQLTNLTVPGSLTALAQLNLPINRLTSFALPSSLTNLASLDLFENILTSFALPGSLTALTNVDLGLNQLTNFTLPAGLTALTKLDLGLNQLTTFAVPPDATNLTALLLAFNQLTNVSLPPGLRNLSLIGLSGNHLKSLDLPSGLTALAFLNLGNNQLTNITLPPDVQQLTGLFATGNPLTTFVLSEPSATTNLADTVTTLRNQGVSVFTYPLAVRLVSPRRTVTGAFEFSLTGPPGLYTVLGTADLSTWHEVGVATNTLGSAVFTDATTILSPRRFYRALRQDPPPNMVFIPPNTFTMGSPTNDLDSSSDERPQTTVTLSRGFWIGKYEVTQGEYLDVTGTNPSDFPGDLSRAVSSVTWHDATNYCWLLTQRELAAGRIPAGSQYRLPTEAEWECAARAGTTTRFSYGDDPSYASVTNYAWFLDLGHPDLTVHAVGQKLPNPWGLYDMHGNVWEWCQDNYGSLPGGVQTDPTGPASTLLRDKLMRGGAYDYPNSSCRSASRLFRFPLWPDSDVGFRVVLVMGP